MRKNREIPPVEHNVVDFDPSGEALPPGFEAWGERCDALWSTIEALRKEDPAPKYTGLLLAAYVARFLVENGLDVADFCDEVKAEAYSHPEVTDG